MAKIFTDDSPYYIIQVGDRLVTVRHGLRTQVHDPAANKTIVYRVTDALMTIAYSGIAYIGDLPTDEWIAQLLYGEPFSRGPDGERPCKAIGVQPTHQIRCQAVQTVLVWAISRVGTACR